MVGEIGADDCYAVCTSLPHFVFGSPRKAFMAFLGEYQVCFHWSGHLHSANQDISVVFSPLFRATLFTVNFKLEPVWDSIALPSLRWTVK